MQFVFEPRIQEQLHKARLVALCRFGSWGRLPGRNFSVFSGLLLRRAIQEGLQGDPGILQRDQCRKQTPHPGMLTKENKKSNKKSWPKLRAKAGEARALISFCRQAVHKYCLKDTEFESRLRQAATSLEACYALLSASQWTLAKMQTTARKFAFYFLALTNCEGQKWFRAKPKVHAFLECSRSPVPPSRTWSYRDESFGHTMSQLATRRGGEFTVLAVSRAVLLKFAADFRKPPLLQ